MDCVDMTAVAIGKFTRSSRCLILVLECSVTVR
jgi:hypothetical protein